ncbi:heterokaryon incompatibility protein-domain-containing protein [Triangularia verruculosa]|uniref:Heterokaryon incompatibility protein-domain-containing protein n=1 Tax=Triangularia verruculosa TaxID=2587418 RepID=A0AAN7AVD9_9PEZI|nr:heterokaryon incompatibility protein-domain-containing protein [Triangularia verruculosa]
MTILPSQQAGAAKCETCNNLEIQDGLDYKDVSSVLIPGQGSYLRCPFCRFLCDAAIELGLAPATPAVTNASANGAANHDDDDDFDIDSWMGLHWNLDTGGLVLSVGLKPMEVFTLQGRELNPRLPRNLPDINLQPDSPSAIAFIQKRLEECERSHPNCKQQNISYCPTRLLYLGDKGGLVYLRERPRISDMATGYAALSYCWGGSGFLKTTRSNLETLKSGFEIAILPQTLRDAVAIARGLAVDYLWIDALCIIQDDPEDWQREAAMMAQVYSNAYITVTALSASSVQDGFLAPRKQLPRFTRAWFDEKSGTTITLTAQPTMNVGLHVLQRSSSAYYNFTLDPVQDRGWCFQEEALSRRISAFSTDEVQWLCRSGMACECRGVDTGPSTKDMVTVDDIRRNPWLFWHDRLLDYSYKQFTFTKDRLPAIAGLARLLQSCTGSDYVAGIWLKSLSRSLGWATYFKKTNPCPETYLAPSFSWASVASPLDTRVNRYLTVEGLKDRISLVDWTLKPKGLDPMGDMDHATLTVEGFLHEAVIFYDGAVGDDGETGILKITIAGQTTELWPDTYLKVSASSTGQASVYRTQEDTFYNIDQWQKAVPALALCLYAHSEWEFQFLVLGPASDDHAGNYERVGMAVYPRANSPGFESDMNARKGWEEVITDPLKRRTITLQ